MSFENLFANSHFHNDGNGESNRKLSLASSTRTPDLNASPGISAQDVVANSDDLRCGCSACPACQLNIFANEVANSTTTNAPRPGMDPLKTSQLYEANARRIICHPKEWSEYVTVICTGWAAATVTLVDGRRQVVSFLLPGDLVSLVSLFGPIDGQSVEAITDVTYRRFKRSDFKTAIANNPNALEMLAATLIDEKKCTNQLIGDLGRRLATEKIARQILYLLEKLTKRGMANGCKIFFPLRRRHIADATGLTPVHVGKVLADLQSSGVISLSNRSLTINNLNELHNIAQWF